ncbi:zinc finger protein ZFP2-like [Mugil cephalus]|uniref:zinc finger protein ZFP2-like n=1 Tax=Mugil cephalus TaxID=48193 RepID=UPI001FB6895D|nr:zinc finger protein ZFP2-like [Mugil cephalus]
MSGAESFRELIIERLTAAAEEIFGLFQRTVVQYEKEIDRQRRLLDITWKPEIELHRTDLPHKHVCTEEEVPTEQQLCNQERNSSLDQEEPEPPQVKVEHVEHRSIQQGEYAALKQETDYYMVTPIDEETEPSKPEPNSDQLLSHNKPVAERPNQEGTKHVNSGSTRNAELKPKRRRNRGTSHSNNVDTAPTLESWRGADRGKKYLTCDICGKAFQFESVLKIHYRTHTGEKPYCCKTCGKSFTRYHSLTLHDRIHTGERPYHCKICGRTFIQFGNLNLHMRTHANGRMRCRRRQDL